MRSRIATIIKFLPIFEAISPDDFARYCESADGTEENPTIGHLQYHPAVCEFMQSCYENGLVLSLTGEHGRTKCATT